MITIAIPTSDMPNKEALFQRCLESLWDQDYQDFEVVVTDNSEDDVIQKMCEYYKTGIRYYKNPIKGMAQNTNEAIRRSKGDLIKILYMDDFLSENFALDRMVKWFHKGWLVACCAHTHDGKYLSRPHTPVYSDDIHTGHNTIGSPSVMMIKNDDPLLFDENMTWLLDCDYYKRMYARYGKPTVVKEILIGIGLHDGQATNTMGEERKLQEYQYIMKKYA